MKATKARATASAKARAKAGAKKILSWWKRGGEESCGFCTHSYAYEMEYRCVACDRGVCPCCVVVRERDLLFCPECDD